MALADNLKGFRPYYDDAKIIMIPVSASQTFETGDTLILSSGSVTLAVYTDTRLVGVAAGECDSLATGTLVPVWADPDTYFVGRQDDTSALTAGSEVDLTGATSTQQLDGDASSTDVFMCIAEVDTAEADGAGKRWIVRINKHEFAQID